MPGRCTPGASVVIAELNKEAGAAVAADLGERALFVHTDVGDLGSCEAMAAAAAEAFGGIDHLVNNAAIFGDMEGVGITTADPAYVETFMRVNVLGATYCTRAVVPSMRERGGGSIVNQSSTAAWMSLSASTASPSRIELGDGVPGPGTGKPTHPGQCDRSRPDRHTRHAEAGSAEFHDMLVQSLASSAWEPQVIMSAQCSSFCRTKQPG